MTNREKYTAQKRGENVGFLDMRTFRFTDESDDPTMEQDLDIMAHNAPNRDTEQYFDDFGVLRNRNCSRPALSVPITDISKWREQFKMPKMLAYRRRVFLDRDSLTEEEYNNSIIIHTITDGVSVKLRNLIGTPSEDVFSVEDIVSAYDTNPVALAELANALAEYYVERIQVIVERSICDAILLKDMVLNADGLLFSQHIWSGVFKPAYTKIIAHAKSLGVDVFYHDNGKFENYFIDDLIAMGVDMIMCVQPNDGNDMTAVLEYTAGRVMVAGGLDWMTPRAVHFMYNLEHIRSNAHDACVAWGGYQHFVPFHALFTAPYSGTGGGTPIGTMCDELARCER